MNIICTVLNSAKRSLKGEEKLSIVFWRWGVGLYSVSLVIGYIVVASWAIRMTFFGTFVGILGYILVFIYPFMLVFSLLRCSKNTPHKWQERTAKIFAIAFIPCIHIWISLFVLWGSTIIFTTPDHFIYSTNPVE